MYGSSSPNSNRYFLFKNEVKSSTSVKLIGSVKASRMLFKPVKDSMVNILSCLEFVGLNDNGLDKFSKLGMMLLIF